MNCIFVVPLSVSHVWRKKSTNKSVEINGNSSIATTVDFVAIKNWLDMLINDLWCCNGISINKVAVLVSFIVTLDITITQR